MLDIKFVRENPDLVDKACESRQNAHWDREKFFELDEERRSVIAEVEALQAARNSASKEIGQLMREGKKEEAEAKKAEVAANKERIATLDDRRDAVEKELFDLVAAIPNIPHEDVPYGKDDSDNPEVRRWGTPREFDFEPKAHWDLGPELGIIDFDRGVKLAGTRFYLLGGMGARMERALINFFIDRHNKAGFKEWWPPVITNHDSLFGTGQLPKFDEDLYHVQPDLYLIPTAEVQLTNIHRDEVLDGSKLPLMYTAFTPCFREEAGSAGRDTRGIIRVHEFDKVEMVKFAKPEDSMNQLESMVAEAELCLQTLGLPYTWSPSAPVTLASAPPSATTSRFGCPATTTTRRSPAAPTAGTSRPVAPTSSTAIRLSSRALATCTPSTALAWPSAAPWLPSSRTTRTRTAPSPCRRPCVPTWAASRSSPPRSSTSRLI